MKNSNFFGCVRFFYDMQRITIHMYVHMITLIYLEIVFGSAEVYRYHFVYIWICI